MVEHSTAWWRRTTRRGGLDRHLACSSRLHAQLLHPGDLDEYNVDWENSIVITREGDRRHLEFSERPGSGIDLDLEECERHPYHEGNTYISFRPGWERREGVRE